MWDAQAAGALGLPMVGMFSRGTSEAEFRAAGATDVFRDIQHLLENVKGSVLGRLLHRRTSPPGPAGGTTQTYNKQEAHMDPNNEAGKRLGQGQDDGSEENPARKQNKRQDADGLADGSGTNSRKSSDQGQEDAGQSFYAG